MDLNQDLNHQPDTQWLLLAAASERLAGARSMQDVVSALRDTAREVVRADGIAVVIRQGEKCFYAAEDAMEPLWAGQHFPVEACISGWAMRHRSTVTIRDVRLDERIPQQAYRPSFVRSLVMVPIGTPEPVAALGAYWSEVRDHDDGAVASLEAMARLASIAIENAKLLGALQASEHRLHLALSVGRGVGTWEWDVQNDLVVADQRFARLYGVDPDQALAGAPIAKFFALVHQEDLGFLQQRIVEALKTGAPFSAEYRLVQPDGSIRWVVAEGQCTLAPDGSPRHFPGVSFDITDRKITEENLRLLNADLERQVIERSSERGTTWKVSPMLLSVIDMANGRFARVNPAWTETLGWAEPELAGAPYVDFVHPEDLAASAIAFQRVQSGMPVLHFENRYRAKDGAYRWLSWVAVPENGKLYSTTRDITEEKEKQDTFAATEEALRQSQKMEAVGQLTGGLAHDFNNLLAGLSGSLEMLQKRISEGRLDAIDRYFAAGMSAVKRASALTHRLLAFSRRQTLDPKPVNANWLIADLEDLIRRTMGPGIDVEVAAKDDLWNILADPNQLENALLNLCINARDAMPDGGKLTIETANKRLDARAAAERELPPGQYVAISVSDNGAGMAADVVSKAFDPFYTTKPIGQGTGLGLSMIYGFTRQSGGQVRIYSELGQGTTVSLYLPQYLGNEQGEIVAEIPGELAPTGAGQVVLVIDDEPIIRMLIADVLAELGYVGIEAADGPTGLRLLQSTERVDLLITDVGLPGGLNGRQVADAARVLRPNLKVLFITGYAENAAIKNGHLDRGMQVTTKPFAIDELSRKIQSMVDDSKPG